MFFPHALPHVHQWRVRRESWDREGRLLRTGPVQVARLSSSAATSSTTPAENTCGANLCYVSHDGGFVRPLIS